MNRRSPDVRNAARGYSFNDSPPPVRISRPALIFGVVSIVSVLAVFSWVWGMNVLHWFTTSWRESAIFWTPVLIGVTIFLVAWFVAPALEEDSAPRFLVRVSGWIVGIGLVLTGIGLSVGAAHVRMAEYYHESSTTVEAVSPSYADRVPFEIAEAVSDTEMQDLTGDARETKSLSDLGDHGLWNTLVNTRGPFQGYEAVQEMDLPLFDNDSSTNDVSSCRFDPDSTLRNSGALPHNNLSRAIYGQVPLNVDYNAGDMYGYCDEAGTPIVVVPLLQIDGWWYPTQTFYGLALYNGTTGELTTVTDAEGVAAVPGPVYPMSLAAIQRESLAASEGWWEQFIANTSGYTAATSNTEVQLRLEDGSDSDYVTTLSPRGSSTSIIGVAHVEATGAVPGTRNTLTVAKLPGGDTRASNKSLEQSLRTRYSQIQDIAADTIQVFEITASTDGRWVLTLGRELSVSYRAYVSADGTSITLVNRNGDVIAQNYDVEGEPAEGLVPTGELSELSDDELLRLGHDIQEEWARRSSQ